MKRKILLQNSVRIIGLLLLGFSNSFLRAETSEIRDPFKKPVIVKSAEKFKEDLEKYSIEELKLVGVITGANQLRAMIKLPNEKTKIVSVRDSIGTRSGVIVNITPNHIEVRETIKDVLGKNEKITSYIEFKSK